MIRTLAPAIAASLIAMSIIPSASAQNKSNLVTQLLLAGNPCTEAADNPSAASAIGICQTALVNVETIKTAHTSMSAHENNIYFVVQALAHTTIGSKMGQIDGARTARTCGELELAWKAFSGVDESQSPASYAGDMKTMKLKAVPAVRLCRSEFGTPFGAPPLP